MVRFDPVAHGCEYLEIVAPPEENDRRNEERDGGGRRDDQKPAASAAATGSKVARVRCRRAMTNGHRAPLPRTAAISPQ
jgi:hypothetical protein